MKRTKIDKLLRAGIETGLESTKKQIEGSLKDFEANWLPDYSKCCSFLHIANKFDENQIYLGIKEREEMIEERRLKLEQINQSSILKDAEFTTLMRK